LSPKPVGPLIDVIGLESSTTTYDEITLGYTGSDLTTIVFKKDGTTLFTLTLTWTSGNLTSVVRS